MPARKSIFALAISNVLLVGLPGLCQAARRGTLSRLLQGDPGSLERCSIDGGTGAGDAHRLSRLGSDHDEYTAFFEVEDLGEVVIWKTGDFDNQADPPVEVDWKEADENYCKEMCEEESRCTAWEYGWYGIQGIGGYYCVGFSEMYFDRAVEDIGGTGSTRFANYAGLCGDSPAGYEDSGEDGEDGEDEDDTSADYSEDYAPDADYLVSRTTLDSNSTKPTEPSKQLVPSSSDAAGAQSKPGKQPVVTGPSTTTNTTNGTSNTTATAPTASSAAHSVVTGVVAGVVVMMMSTAV